MKIVLTLTLMIAIISSASIGCLVIFEVISTPEGKDYLLKSLAAITLIGFSSALIALLTATKNAPEE